MVIIPYTNKNCLGSSIIFKCIKGFWDQRVWARQKQSLPEYFVLGS